jgi:hypothetical protein
MNAKALAAAAFLLIAPASAFANPSMATDFQAMMDWLAHEMAQGIAFNAGSTFDPPHEVVDHRLSPDISFGAGHMPLDKSKFPTPQTQALADYHPESIFPATVLFPNLAAHLRGGLPGRFDFAIRAADMTTPPGYKISPTTKGVGQSNSIGFSVRKHLLGGEDLPLVTLGAHFNHVYGRFLYSTHLNINNSGFQEDADVNGGIIWNVNSFGLNAVTSYSFGRWRPFGGFGYNYVTGSVRANLKVNPTQTGAFGITPFSGEASEHPEQNQGRVIFGFQHAGSWLHLFTNGEVKAIGIGAGKTWILQSGISLPFHIGVGSGGRLAERQREQERAEQEERRLARSARQAQRKQRELTQDEAEALARIRVKRRSEIKPHREIFSGTRSQPESDERTEGTPTMIFIQ